MRNNKQLRCIAISPGPAAYQCHIISCFRDSFDPRIKYIYSVLIYISYIRMNTIYMLLEYSPMFRCTRDTPDRGVFLAVPASGAMCSSTTMRGTSSVVVSPSKVETSRECCETSFGQRRNCSPTTVDSEESNHVRKVRNRRLRAVQSC